MDGFFLDRISDQAVPCTQRCRFKTDGRRAKSTITSAKPGIKQGFGKSKGSSLPVVGFNWIYLRKALQEVLSIAMDAGSWKGQAII